MANSYISAFRGYRFDVKVTCKSQLARTFKSQNLGPPNTQHI